MSLGLTDSQYYSDIADAIREKTGSAAELAPSEMSAAIAEIGIKFPTSNLWGGLQMAIDLDKAGLSSAAPVDNYISLTGSYTMSSRTAVDNIFKENTQYTCILAYENNSAYSGGNITANLAFSYSDGTTDDFVIPNSTADIKYIHAFVSAEDKTVTKIICIYQWETAKIYYNESGVFEGVKTVEDFEPYNRYGVPTTIGTFFNFTPNANTTPTGVMLFKNGNTMYCVYTCNNDEFYYNVATSKIIRTGFYYADAMPSTIPANYRDFFFQNGGDITDVAQSNLGNYFIHSTYDIKDENGNVLIPKDVNIEDFGF